MTTPLDLGPAARLLADLVGGTPDERLADPTPCAGTSVGALIDHVSGAATTFAAAARRTPVTSGGPPPAPAADHLGPGWRDRIAAELADLADAWRDPEAWTGSTQAAGVDLSGAVAGLFAADEVVVHGWDLAVALGRPYAPDAAALQAVHDFLADFTAANPGGRPGLFGPAVAVPAAAPLLDRTVALTGRDPAWAPGTPAATAGRTG